MIRVELNGKVILERFDRMVTAAHDTSVPNRQLATQLYGWTQRNFQSGGSMQTPVWAPLKASTAKQKARKGYSPIPLIRTGHLRQSFRPFWNKEQAGIGSEVPYAQYHEAGTERLPQRAMLPPESVASEYARVIYGRWAEGLAKLA